MTSTPPSARLRYCAACRRMTYSSESRLASIGSPARDSRMSRANGPADTEGQDLEVRRRIEGDQDVGGLQVAVDDAALMGVLDGVADLGNDGKDHARLAAVILRVAHNTRAVHQLHRDVRRADVGA